MPTHDVRESETPKDQAKAAFDEAKKNAPDPFGPAKFGTFPPGRHAGTSVSATSFPIELEPAPSIEQAISVSSPPPTPYKTWVEFAIDSAYRHDAGLRRFKPEITAELAAIRSSNIDFLLDRNRRLKADVASLEKQVADMLDRCNKLVEAREEAARRAALLPDPVVPIETPEANVSRVPGPFVPPIPDRPKAYA